MKVFARGNNIITEPTDVYGCTNPLSANYNPLATIDDGSCSGFALPTNGVIVDILIGQSNCSGSALNSSALASEIDSTNTLLIWDRTTAFVNLNIGASNNYGGSATTHGRELALSLLYDSVNPLYMIKRGSSGTPIVDHLVGGAQYNLYWPEIKAGINNLINAGKRPFVRLNFHQGEADGDSIDSPFYSDRFDTWVALWRTNLGANLPITVTEIKESLATSYIINDVFHAKALTDDLLWVIDAKDLSTNIGDTVHLDYDAQKTVGNSQFTILENVEPVEITSLL